MPLGLFILLIDTLNTNVRVNCQCKTKQAQLSSVKAQKQLLYDKCSTIRLGFDFDTFCDRACAHAHAWSILIILKCTLWLWLSLWQFVLTKLNCSKYKVNPTGDMSTISLGYITHIIGYSLSCFTILLKNSQIIQSKIWPLSAICIWENIAHFDLKVL